MTTANIYLTFNGNCEDAFNFYKSVFGSEFSYLGRFNEMPDAQGSKEDLDKIMHVGLPIGKDTVIMGSDVGPEWSADFVLGNNFSISIHTDSTSNADRLFNELSAGGLVTMPMNKTFWGDYFGMLTDKFGINWMIAFNETQQN